MSLVKNFLEFFWRKNPAKQDIATSDKMSREEFVAMLAKLIGNENFNENEAPDGADIMLLTTAASYKFLQPFYLNMKPTGRELFDDLYQQYLKTK